MRSVLLWDITQSTLVIPYPRFGTSYRSHFQESRNQRSSCLYLKQVSSWISCPLKMGPIGCPETSVRKCHHTLRNGRKESGCQFVFGCVLLTERNVMHFLVPKFLLRSVSLSSSPSCIQNSLSVFCRCRLRVSLRAHWVYLNLFRNLLVFASLIYTVAKNCRGIRKRVRYGVRLACCDVILSRVNLKAFLRNVLPAFSESPPLTSLCLCQTAWPYS